jgi:effector-binding domain-containing protein
MFGKGVERKNAKMKKLMILLGFVLTAALVWILFLKPYDYVAVIEAKTVPGVINQFVKTWSNSLENSDLHQRTDIEKLDQTLVVSDSSFLYEWKITQLNDSVSKINIGVTGEKMNSVALRLANLLSDTAFEKRIKSTLLDFNEKLQEHLESFRVRIDGESELESSYCACVTLESDQFQKAMGMMRNYNLLGNALLENGIEMNGQPFIEIIKWDRTKDRIKYNFCYPIIRNDTLASEGPVAFKEFQGRPAIKATYNGNYISSDRAWYFLLDYADKNGIRVSETPVEIFFNNPNVGGDALEWRADIYLPLAE